MSIVPKETIEVIAQSIGINNLSPDVALALSPDVEYHMREIMQEAIKCMRHSKRTMMTTDDVDSALNLRNVEPIYGFASGDPLRFRRAVGHKDLFYLDDKDLDFKDVIEAPLPKAPLDTSIVCHWLAIEGVQPAIPENAPVEVIIAAPPDNKKPEQKDDGLPVDIKLPVKHVLSRELQLYFDKITELAMSRSDSVLYKEALVSLATDSGLHPLVPYFTYFIADEVSRGLNEFRVLFSLMRLVGSLLQNPHIHIEPYLHQLMPSVVTCLVAKRLGNRFADNHWELRDFTAKLVASICKRFGHVYSNLQTRLTKTLVHTFLDPKRALTQHYGAIQGLAALGPNVVRLLLLPNLETYMKLLEPEMRLERQKNEIKRYEAWRVYGALLRAAGQCIYDRLKLFPNLPSPPPNVVWRTNARVITATPHKGKATMEHLEHQPPHKKVATDGPINMPASNSLPPEIQGVPGTPAALGDSDAGASPSSKQMSGEGISGSRGKVGRGNKNQALDSSAMLNQAWKDDLDSGRLLVSLFELFGESIFNFIPTPEMSSFL
ncbi:transcription initiation factor TFIID subunit 6 isoform X1 [Rhododendron vialii]|uniref:transcription initiation factor TFIID subunit 6 isoform X1 n=1 Tax=Rhododendron vialii TaxID=182163 RepID=UPI00265DDC58|nr:transcription initiation factor TFIID subunit 6 isoform X1 [Rhododendron vialii]